jgi:hypothetical protein
MFYDSLGSVPLLPNGICVGAHLLGPHGPFQSLGQAVEQLHAAGVPDMLGTSFEALSARAMTTSFGGGVAWRPGATS